MKSRLLRHAAVFAVVLTPSLALAQAPAGGERAEHGGAAGAPGGAMERNGGGGGGAEQRGGAMERNGGEKGAPGGTAGERGGPAHSAPATAGEGKGEKTNGERNNAAPGRAGPNERNEKAGGQRPAAGQRDQNEHRGEAGQKGATDHKDAPGQKGETERGGARANRGNARSVQVTTEQKTRITTTIRSQHVEALHGVDFAVRSGTVVPTRYTFHSLPPEIVTLVPEFRGYDYILVDEQIIIIDPSSREIVDIIVE